MQSSWRLVLSVVLVLVLAASACGDTDGDLADASTGTTPTTDTSAAGDDADDPESSDAESGDDEDGEPQQQDAGEGEAESDDAGQSTSDTSEDDDTDDTDNTGEPEPEEDSTDDAEPAEDDADTQNDDGGEGDGEEEDTDVAAELQDALDAWRENNGAPGASLSVRLADGESISLASGVVDLAGDEPVEPDDYFRIASITKPMTSVIVLQLAEEGLVDLDEPVTTYLGDWLGDHPNEDIITVRQLLNHTNGLVEYAFDPGFYIEAAARQDRAYEPEEILDYLGRQDPLFEPGEAYQYETGGFVAAGLLIEEVTGNPAFVEMETRVFGPSGAQHIYLTPSEFPPDPVVNAYVRAELYDALILLPGVDDTDGLTVNGEPVLDILGGEQAVLQSAGWTGGGNEARLSDVSAIFRAMFNGRLLTEDSVGEMTTTALDTNYGLGLDVNEVNGHTVYQHGGGVPGFRSQAGYLPDHDIAYAFSASLIPLPDGGGVGELQRALLDIVLGE